MALIQNEVAFVFKPYDGRFTIHMEYPTKEQVVEYAKTLDAWDNLYVSMRDGKISTFRSYILNLIN